MMNETLLDVDGRVLVVGDAGSVAGVIADMVRAASTPATYDEDGVELTPEIVPEADTLILPLSRTAIKTHIWRLPRVRVERLAQIRALRDAKLLELDREANHALTGRPGQRPVPAIEAGRRSLRDLPPVAEAALAALTNTDDIDAYLPAELT